MFMPHIRYAIHTRFQNELLILKNVFLKKYFSVNLQSILCGTDNSKKAFVSKRAQNEAYLCYINYARAVLRLKQPYFN